MPAYRNLTDQKLATLLSEGNGGAFSEIYNRYHSLLYTYANKKLRNKQEAEDIVQDILTTLWNNRFDFSLQTSLASYLYTAVRNKSLDLFCHRKVEAKYIASLQHFIDDAGTSSDFLIREKDLRALIEREIQMLPPRMREVFELSRKNSLTHREIANLLEISEQTVATQIKKALKLLRMRLGLVTWLLMLLTK